MKKNKAFTLIELLAVIVIMGIIATIFVPMFSNYIEKSKREALKESAFGIISAADLYQSSNEEMEDKEFSCVSDSCNSETSKIDYKGKIDSGKVKVYSDGETSICIQSGRYSAIKLATSSEIIVSEGICNYSSETYKVDKVVSYEEYKKMEDKSITLQNELNTLKSTGTAIPSEILLGKTALINGELVTGTLVKDNWNVLTGTLYSTNSANIFVGVGKTVYAGVVSGAARVYRTDGETMYTAGVSTYYNSGNGYVSFYINPDGPLYLNTGNNFLQYVILYK